MKKAQIGFTADYSTGLAAYVYTHTISEKKESIHRKYQRKQDRAQGGWLGGGRGGESQTTRSAVSPAPSQPVLNVLHTGNGFSEARGDGGGGKWRMDK